jgi:hypothetical protein
MNKEVMDEIVAKLQKAGATQPCHRCGASEFTVVEGFTHIYVQDAISGGVHIGGPSVPVTHVACISCGALTAHALGLIGMLPKEDQTDDG